MEKYKLVRQTLHGKEGYSGIVHFSYFHDAVWAQEPSQPENLSGQALLKPPHVITKKVL